MRTLLLAPLLAALTLLPGAASAAAKPVKVELGAVRSIAPDASATDIKFKSPSGNTVTGELIAGTGGGAHPAVLFVHWLGEPATTNHTEFEHDATLLAGRGATSLLIDTMWARPKWFETMGKSADADVAVSAKQIEDLRASLDVLMAQPGIDEKRVAFVGHDFGAMFGALLSKTDSRPQYYVLLAGTTSLTEWYLLGKKVADRDAYTAKLAQFDILGSLKASHAQGYLFQFSAKDYYISPESEAAFASAAPLPRGAFYYDADHALELPAVFRDRQAWLADKLFGK